MENNEPFFSNAGISQLVERYSSCKFAREKFRKICTEERKTRRKIAPKPILYESKPVFPKNLLMIQPIKKMNSKLTKPKIFDKLDKWPTHRSNKGSASPLLTVSKYVPLNLNGNLIDSYNSLKYKKRSIFCIFR